MMTPHDLDEFEDELLQIEFGCHPDPGALKMPSPNSESREELRLRSRALAELLRSAASSDLAGWEPQGLPAPRSFPWRGGARVAAALLIMTLIPLGISAWAWISAEKQASPAVTIIATTPANFQPGGAIPVALRFLNQKREPVKVQGSWSVDGQVLGTQAVDCDGSVDLFLPAPASGDLCQVLVVAKTDSGQEKLQFSLARAMGVPKIRVATDRLVYHPGEALNFAAISPSIPPPPGVEDVVLSARNSSGQLLFASPALPFGGGTASTTWELPQTLPPGSITTEARSTERDTLLGFHLVQVLPRRAVGSTPAPAPAPSPPSSSALKLITPRRMIAYDSPLEFEVISPQPSPLTALVLEDDLPIARRKLSAERNQKVAITLPKTAVGRLRLALVDPQYRVRGWSSVQRSSEELRVQIHGPQPLAGSEDLGLEIRVLDRLGQPVQGRCSVSIVDSASPEIPPASTTWPAEPQMRRVDSLDAHREARGRWILLSRRWRRLAGGLLFLGSLIALACGLGRGSLHPQASKGLLAACLLLSIGLAWAPSPIIDSGATGSGQEPGDLPILASRLDLRPTLVFDPDLRCDRNGRALLRFPRPPDHGRWRVEVEARSENRVGRARFHFDSPPPLALAVDMPELMREGDRLAIPISVATTQPGLKSCEVTVQATGLGRSFDSKLQLPLIEGRGSAFIDATAELTGETPRIECSAVAGRDRQSGWTVFSVAARGERHREARNGFLSSETSIALPKLSFAPGVKTKLKLYPSPLAEIRDGVEGILANDRFATLNLYRALRAEQSAARVLLRGIESRKQVQKRRLLLAEARASMTLPRPGDPRDLNALGFLALSHSTFDPAWSHGRSELWPSLRAGLRKTTVATERPPGRIRKKNRVSSLERALHTCALAVEGPQTAELEQRLLSLERAIQSPRTDPYLLAVSARALQLAGRSQAAASARDSLVNWQRSDGRIAGAKASVWGATGVELDVETTAAGILAWTDGSEHLESTSRAIRWLRFQRKPQGSFGATGVTTAALEALGRWAEVAPAPQGKGRLKILRDGAVLLERSLYEIIAEPLVIPLPASSPPLGDRLQVEYSGKSTVPWTLEFETPAPRKRKMEQALLSITTQLSTANANCGEMIELGLTIRNLSSTTATSVSADISLPSALVVKTRVLDAYQSKAVISNWAVAPGVLRLAWKRLGPANGQRITIPVVARFAGDSEGARSRIWVTNQPQTFRSCAPLKIRVRPLRRRNAGKK